MKAGSFQYCRDVMVVLIAKDFKVRYKNTLLGYAWSLVHPLLFALVFFVVLSRLLMRDYGEEIRPYPLFLITALFPWQWFSNSVNASTFFFWSNSTLIKKVRFPREFLVYSAVLSDCIHFVISIPVIVIFMLWYGRYPSIHWLWQVPLLILVQFFITQGLALFLATTNLFFRDLGRLTGIFMMLWFYLTPVIYPPRILGDEFRWVVYANPMASLILCWRSVFLTGTISPDMLGISAAFAVTAFLLGYSVYRRLEWRFAEIV